VTNHDVITRQVGQFADGLYHGVADPAKFLWNLTGRALYDPKGAAQTWGSLGKGKEEKRRVG